MRGRKLGGRGEESCTCAAGAIRELRAALTGAGVEAAGRAEAAADLAGCVGALTAGQARGHGGRRRSQELGLYRQRLRHI